MDNIFAVVIFVICSALLIIVLKGQNEGFAFAASIVAVFGLLLLILPSLSALLTSVKAITEVVSQGPFDVVVKAIGISVLSQITGDMCKDAGQTALRSLILLCGKVSIVMVALPLFQDLLLQVINLIG